MKITPCGTFRPKHAPPLTEKKIERKKPLLYNEYLIAECLTKKLSSEECKRYNIILDKNENAWYFNDNKVPLCGEMGIAIVREGQMIKKIPLGIH